MQTIVSVIVPCFNYGRYLSDAIHSLIGGSTSLGDFAPQTMQSFEIIIVDDASTDGTYEFARSFIGERVSYIRNPENVGTAAALNVGIRQAKGQLITFLSADDMMETNRLEKLVEAWRSSPHSVVFDNLMTFKDGQRLDNMPLQDYDFDRLLYKNTMAAGILYPRAAWQEVGGYPESFRDGREDWAFNVLLGTFGYCGIHVKEPLYLYRREGQNRSLSNGGAENRIRWLQKMQAQFPALYRGERPKMCCNNGNKKTVSMSRSSPGRNQRQGANIQYNEPLTVGVDGMVLIEYQLPKAGTVLYTGAVTSQQYAFSSSRKRNYVDARDAPALLNRIEDRRRAFVQVKTTPPEPVKAPTIVPNHNDPASVEMTPIDVPAVIDDIPTVTVTVDKPKRSKKLSND